MQNLKVIREKAVKGMELFIDMVREKQEYEAG